MQVQKMPNTIRIRFMDDAVFERFKYWLSDSEGVFTADCQMDGILPDNHWVDMVPDHGGNIVHAIVRS